ncbi:MAG: BTAD domain-containing putative transcriptional regulator [Actinomycetota bacterium]
MESPEGGAGDEPAKSVVLEVLGPVRARKDEQLLDLGSNKPHQLLIVLAVSPEHRASSSRLADELWGPGADRAKIPDRIKNAVWQLNNTLEERFGIRPVASRGSEGYQLDGGVVGVDGHRFLASGEHAGRLHVGGDLLEAHRLAGEALALWRDDEPYPGYDGLPAVVDHVAVLTRERLATAKVHVETAIELGRHREILPELERLTAISPTDEGIGASYIVALARDGRRREALDAYERLRTMLLDGGFEVPRELERLARQVLSGDDRVLRPTSHQTMRTPTVVAPLPAALKALGATAFHGRDAELARTLALLDRGPVPAGDQDATGTRRATPDVGVPDDGRSEPVVVIGDAGMGKTRFLAALATELSVAGRRVLYGRCSHEDTTALAALSGFAELAPAEESDGPPAPGDGGPRLSLAVEVDPSAWLDRRIDRAVDILLGVIGDDAPVLVLDDVQWADRASLTVLDRLGTRATVAPSFVFAGRPRADEVGDDDLVPPRSAIAASAHLLAEHRWQPVELGPLDDRAVAGLVADVLPHGERNRAEAVAELIQSNGHGVPLHVTEMVQAVQAEVASGRPFTLGHIQAVVPEDLQAAVRGRMRRLGPEAADVVKVAAVAGPVIELEVLARVTGRSEDETAALLDHGVAERLIAESSDGVLGRYHFAHELLREAVLGDIGRNHRARLHRRFAAAIEELDLEGRPGERATHLIGALPLVDADDAVATTLEAAQGSVARFDVDGAIGLLTRALDALDGLDVPEHRICDLLIALGTVQTWGGERTAAAQSLDAAVEASRRMNDPFRLAEAVLATGPDHRVVFDSGGRLGLLREAHDQLSVDEPTPQAIKVEAALLGESLLPGRPEQPVGPPGDLIERARAVGDPAAVLEALLAAHSAGKSQADAEVRARYVDEIVALAERDPAFTRQLCGGLGCRAYDQVAVGEFEAAAATVDALRQLGRKHTMPRYQWRAAVVEGALLRLAGRFDRADELAVEAQAIGKGFDPVDADIVFGMQLHETMRHARQLGSLVEVLDKAVDVDSPPVARLLVVQAMAADDDLYNAERRWAEERESVLDPAPKELWLPAVALAAELATTAIPDVDAAVALERTLTPFAGQWVPVGVPVAVWGPVDLYLGLLAALRGRSEAAEVRLRSAEAQCRTAGAEPWRTRVVELATDFGFDVSGGSPA